MKKNVPDFKTDAEAERFVNSADLSDYDFSDMVPTRFELKPTSAYPGPSFEQASEKSNKVETPQALPRARKAKL